MAKRIKKPTVKQEQRKEWLRRYESGESIAKIADSDDYDVRTVRRHVEQARQEREVKEARLTVLRSALENHYADLCNFAEILDAYIAREEAVPTSTKDSRMWAALKQHLPRSLLWPSIDKWNNVREELRELEEAVTQRLESAAASNPRLLTFLPALRTTVVSGIAKSLVFQMKCWTREQRVLVLENNLYAEPAGEGLVNLRYGAFQLAKTAKEHIATIREVLREMESGLSGLDEYARFQKLYRELERLKRNLRDELAIITLRRIVQGRCKYCPL